MLYCQTLMLSSRREVCLANSIRTPHWLMCPKKYSVFFTDLPSLIFRISGKCNIYIIFEPNTPLKVKKTRICPPCTENRYLKFGYSMKIMMFFFIHYHFIKYPHEKTKEMQMRFWRIHGVVKPPGSCIAHTSCIGVGGGTRLDAWPRRCVPYKAQDPVLQQQLFDPSEL